MTSQFTPSNLSEWRKWLAKNHASESEVLLVFWKKATGKPTLSYNEAVEEALCWGWIDGVKRRIDDERYCFRFTPRREKSIWSETNIKRVEKLLGEKGRMQPAGQRLIDYAKKAGTFKAPPPGPKHDMHPDFAAALKASQKANAFFETMTPKQKQKFIGWTTSAKKDETRHRRIGKAIDMLEKGIKFG